MEKFKVEKNIEIKPYNIDAAGHVNNAVYINWFEDLRIKLFENYFNFRELFKMRMYPVVTSTEIVYKKILHLYDQPVGSMYLESSRHGVIILKAKIKLDENTAAYGTQKCVLYDLENSKILKDFELQDILKNKNN